MKRGGIGQTLKEKNINALHLKCLIQKHCGKKKI